MHRSLSATPLQLPGPRARLGRLCRATTAAPGLAAHPFPSTVLFPRNQPVSLIPILNQKGPLYASL